MTDRSTFESYFQILQKACLPGVWSKAVAMARDVPVVEDSRKDDEVILRIVIPNQAVSPKVTLWPSPEEPEEADWHCNCGDRNDPCVHIAAAAIAIRNGTVRSGAEAAPTSAGILNYRFSRKNNLLRFERWVVYPARPEKNELLTQSLVSYVGGISSGRIAAAAVAATREDYLADAALNDRKGGELDPATLTGLLSALAQCSNITLDGESITTSRQSVGSRIRITDEKGGVRLQLVQERNVDESFANGVVRVGNVLYPRARNGLSPEENSIFSGAGKYFPQGDSSDLVSTLLPALEQKIPVENESQNLPKAIRIPPRIILETTAHPQNRLSILPVIVYGAPPIARMEFNRFKTLSRTEIPLRDPDAERALARKLQLDLHLQPGQAITLEGEEAIRFVAETRDWEIAGEGRRTFEPTDTLSAKIETSERGFHLEFNSSRGSADPKAVFQAWKDGGLHVPLLEGGWARLPQGWLEKYGERISALLAARDTQEALPSWRLPELANLCEDLGQTCAPSLARLRILLADFKGIPEAPLPPDLQGELRSYQKSGINWLHFLRQQGMGAMLADDMGLGKTLQALCVLQPTEKTLVVVPTSVLGSWHEQIRKFRPSLKCAIYHGSGRKLPEDAPIILTTYAILRIDQEILGGREWDTVILDEAQTIRNPESQVTQAAHRLRAKFRLTLSGTPVENRLEDLWSQFQFLNPGLLGTREEFAENHAGPISRGDREAADRLHRRIRPFILRRLKREVAAELPPRIETVLECELTSQEREIYEAILAASRDEVIRQLEQGGNILGALEVLLRLRQACCHAALVPGQSAPSSSKIDLLLETLDTSISEGHRSLVFSQWTSLLDLIEPHLNQRGIPFLRLDGATRDRDAVVTAFQADAGPPVLLMSLKAGGMGLTLTAADHVFLLDPWWNPATENQAADRAHRIGQTQTVMIHRLVAKNTIEERVLALQQAKSRLAEAILQGSALAAAPTREDILALLES